MLSSASDELMIRSRLQFSQSSEPAASQDTASQQLNNAFNDWDLKGGSTQYGQQDADVSMTQAQAGATQTQTGTTQSHASQANGMQSQDFVTPVEQQFDTAPSLGGKKMRSPGRLTPKGNKRHRGLIPTASQGPEEQQVFTQNLSNIVRDVRHSPRCTHNAFGDQCSPEAVRVARRLPNASNFYREFFKEDRMLGQGNFSTVYLAKSRMDGMEYAIKRSKYEVAEEALKRQWFQEIQALAASGAHINVVRYFTSWVEEQRNGVHFYVQLERCGSSLGQRFCVDRRPFKETELVDILRQLAEALHHLHGLGIAHMDIKPDNIYTANDRENVYKLGDFGLATRMPVRPGVDVQEGDSRYLPREVLNGDYSQLDKADMFALGATLYQLATGTDLPESGESYENIRQGRLKLMPMISTGLQGLLKRMISINPSHRPSAEQVLSDKQLKKHPKYNQLDLRPACA